MAQAVALHSLEGESVALTEREPPSSCRVRPALTLRIAIAAFGGLRDSQTTLNWQKSLQKNVIAQLGFHNSGVDVFMHTWIHSKIPAEVKHILCKLRVDDQDEFDRQYDVEARAKAAAQQDQSALPLMRYYSQSSFMNMYRAQRSKQLVARLITKHEHEMGFNYTHLIVARVDGCYLSPLIWDPIPDGIRVPNMHQFDGVNDQFAYGASSLSSACVDLIQLL